MRIAVLGGGNGAHAAVADFTEAGHAVRWWRRDAGRHADLRRAGHLTVVDATGERQVPVALATDDMAAALDGADLILAPAPAFAQADLARAMAPHLADGQVIYLPPGTFGSYLMAKLIREAGARASVAIAETGTLPWLARKAGPARIAIATRATRLPTGVFPASRTTEALEIVARAFPRAIEPLDDALSGALMNAGPIIHPPLILMNAGAIEHFERWDIHNEGTQPAIRRVHWALDAERVALREALGYGPPHFPLRDHYETSDWMYGDLAHDKLVSSGGWHEPLDLVRHRYMQEDIALGLAFLVSLGEWAGVPMPVARALLTLGGTVAQTDFLKTGRTMAALGLDGQSRAGLTALLRDGFAG